MSHTPAVPPAPEPAERFTVRSVEDLIALVPVVIGFEPEESLTLLSFAARPPGRTFHARVDLPPVDAPPVAEGVEDEGVEDEGDGPPEPEALADLVRSVAEPVARHRVSLAALVVHSARPVLAAAVARRTARALAGKRAGPGSSESGSGVRLVGCLRAHDGHWFQLPGPDDPPGPGPEEGVPYDVSLHPFVLRSVVAGRVLHPSRAALAASLDADPRAVAEVRARTADRLPPRGAAEQAWAREVVGRAARRAESVAVDDGARLLHGMRDVRVRDAAWSTMTRTTAPRHVALWTDLVRRAPAELLPAPGALLAFAAWLAGDGALAWCALDRVRAADPAYRLADLVAETLERACDPGLWAHDGSAFTEDPAPAGDEASATVLPGPWPLRACSRGPERG